MKKLIAFTFVMALLLVLAANNDFTQTDKEKYLGKVSNSQITMKVYSVKGDAEGEYIYALWDWEGAFYKREE